MFTCLKENQMHDRDIDSCIYTAAGHDFAPQTRSSVEQLAPFGMDKDK